jgi:hypothetical protein
MVSTDIVIAPPEGDSVVQLGVVHANRPAELVQRATEAANALASVIEQKHLYSDIQGKRFVRCEGWTTLAAMMGCLPREVASVRRDDGAYEVTVELARMSDGQPLTRATAECGKDEPTWAKRPDYARRSMAATRATSKACRQAFSWVMALTGFEVTPAEEIPQDERPAKRVPLSQPPAALTKQDDGEVFDDVDKNTGEQLVPLAEASVTNLRTLIREAGIKGADFGEFYQKATGREYAGRIYGADEIPLKKAATRLLAGKK